jgi:hypothetical protein
MTGAAGSSAGGGKDDGWGISGSDSGWDFMDSWGPGSAGAGAGAAGGAGSSWKWKPAKVGGWTVNRICQTYRREIQIQHGSPNHRTPPIPHPPAAPVSPAPRCGRTAGDNGHQAGG